MPRSPWHDASYPEHTGIEPPVIVRRYACAVIVETPAAMQ